MVQPAFSPFAFSTSDTSACASKLLITVAQIRFGAQLSTKKIRKCVAHRSLSAEVEIAVNRPLECAAVLIGSEAGQGAHAPRRAIDGQSYHAPRRAILHADPIADCGRNPHVCSASNTCKHRYDKGTHYEFTSNELRFAAPWKPISCFGVVLRPQWPLTQRGVGWARPAQRRAWHCSRWLRRRRHGRADRALACDSLPPLYAVACRCRTRTPVGNPCTFPSPPWRSDSP